jgi:hypothetical protein
MELVYLIHGIVRPHFMAAETVNRSADREQPGIIVAVRAVKPAIMFRMYLV